MIESAGAWVVTQKIHEFVIFLSLSDPCGASCAIAPKEFVIRRAWSAVRRPTRTDGRFFSGHAITKRRRRLIYLWRGRSAVGAISDGGSSGV